MLPEMLSVSIVVPVRNGERTIRGCIESLVKTSGYVPVCEILIVDNGSTDGTAQIIRDFPVTCLYESRRGPSHARNKGIMASRGNVLAFTDADCVVDEHWLVGLLKGFSEQEVWGAAGEIESYPPKTPAERFAALLRSRWQVTALQSERPFAVTANVAFRRKTFDRIGLFDPYFIRGEDQEFSRRFFGAGLKMKYCPEALVFHHHRSTITGLLWQEAGWAMGDVLLKNYSAAVEFQDTLKCLEAFLRGCTAYKRKKGNRIGTYFLLVDLLRALVRWFGGLYGLMGKDKLKISGTHPGAFP